MRYVLLAHIGDSNGMMLDNPKTNVLHGANQIMCVKNHPNICFIKMKVIAVINIWSVIEFVIIGI